MDYLIPKYNLKYCKVVLSHKEAKDLKLPIDHNDHNAWGHNKPFSLLIHGTNPVGSKAMEAVMSLRKSGHMGYSLK